MEITSGKQPCAIKCALYGPEGIGKSTLAAQFPDPLFIDTENGTAFMDVRRLPKPQTWEELLSEVDWVYSHPDSCKTLVIDTADWAEHMCVTFICVRDKKDGIESYSYGKGYTYLSEAFGLLIDKLENVRKKGVHIVITAHATIKKFEQPDELGAYDRWSMKTSKQVAPLIREWVDALLFLNYKTLVVNVDNQGAAKGKNKAQGGMRVIYTTHHPCWDAKNRFGLPEELPLQFESIAPILGDTAAPAPAPTPATAPPKAPAPERQMKMDLYGAPPEAPVPPEVPPEVPPQPAPAEEDDDIPPEPLRTMMAEAGVTSDEVKGVIADKGFYSADTPWKVIRWDEDFWNGWVTDANVWPQIVQAAKADRQPPF